jgi:hypothetical protein
MEKPKNYIEKYKDYLGNDIEIELMSDNALVNTYRHLFDMLSIYEQMLELGGVEISSKVKGEKKLIKLTDIEGLKALIKEYEDIKDSIRYVAKSRKLKIGKVNESIKEGNEGIQEAGTKLTLRHRER